MKKEENFSPDCAWPGCKKKGLYPAPKSRAKKEGYVFFCLEHVREYNAKWDYLADFSEKEIERFIRESTVWERPTWSFGRKGIQGTEKKERKPKAVCEALKVLGLAGTVPFAAVKARYRSMVKKFHPDARGGDVREIEKFHKLQQAFAILRRYYAMQGAKNVVRDKRSRL